MIFSCPQYSSIGDHVTDWLQVIAEEIWPSQQKDNYEDKDNDKDI